MTAADDASLPETIAPLAADAPDFPAATPPHDSIVVVSHRNASATARGRLWIVLAAVLWSSSGLFAKSPIFADWPLESRGILLAFWRALFAGALLIPVVRRPRWDVKLIPLCVTFALMNLAYLSAMTATTAANAIWMQSTAPWWVFLVGVLFLHEPFSPWERIPLVAGGLGLAIILSYEIRGQAPMGVFLGLFSGFAYAGVVMCLRSLRALDAVWLVVVSHLATAALMAPYVVYLDRWPSGTQLLVLAAFGFFQMALPYVFFARGLRTVTSQEATGIGLLEPLLLPLWVYLAWDEAPAPWTLVGGGLILTGLVLRYALPLWTRRSATLQPQRGVSP